MAEILLPVGRMIGGSLYKPQPKLDNFGKPKLGADGKPLTGYNFGVAIPKAGEQHWAQTAWGAQIKAVGDAAYPGISGTPAFAWKVIDGDSAIPNKKNRKPCDQEGYRGHWVLWFSQTWAPKICNANGTQELTEIDAVVPGYFVQVYCSVKGNAPSPTPGVYLNPMAVALAGYGQRIETSSVDTAAVGFGNGPAPAGMMATPPGATTPPIVAQPNVSVGNPYGTATPPAGMVAPPPNPAFLAPPPARQMTAAATATYEQYVSAGWNDAQLIAAGLMVG